MQERERKQRDDEEALYRFMIISPLLGEPDTEANLKDRIADIAAGWHEHPRRGYERLAHKTIEEWYYRYRHTGFHGLAKKSRRDRGRSRSIDAETGERILALRLRDGGWSVRKILAELARTGDWLPGELSSSSIYRFLAHHRAELVRADDSVPRKRKFQFSFANECWQGDVCHGPKLRFTAGDERQRIYLFAFIDDATRLIPYASFYDGENLQNFIDFLKNAVSRRGIPDRLYLDNAGYFKNATVQQIGARLGIRTLYCTPYSPYKKGKIERWFRTMRDGFLRGLDLERVWTFDALNEALSEWIEKEYHHSIHATLECSPLEAWRKKMRAFRYPDRNCLERDFLASEDRLVRRDGTVQLMNRFYEVDSTLAGETVELRYDPFEAGSVHVYLDEQYLMKSKPVDPEANSQVFRGGKRDAAGTERDEDSGEYLRRLTMGGGSGV